MTSQEIYEIATTEFGLSPRLRADGYSYWTVAQDERKSVRIFRASQDDAGMVTEIKLAVSSLREGSDTFLNQPITIDRLRDAILREVEKAY